MGNQISAQDIIKRVIEETRMSIRGFALHMNESYDKIFGIYCGKTKTISPQVMDSIVETYGVNRRFLMTGDGNVFTEEKQSTDDIVQHLFEVINLLKEQNDILKRSNEQQTEHITELEKRNEELAKKVDELTRKLP